MFKTPRNEQKRKSGVTEADVTKTPVVVLDPSEVDPSVLDTPEETGVCCCSENQSRRLSSANRLEPVHR